MSATRYLLPFLPPLVLGLAVAGCGGGGSSGGGGTSAGATPTGEVQLRVTDAPPQDLVGVTKAEIVVERVEIMEVNSASSAGVGSGAGNGNGNGNGQGMANGNGQGSGQQAGTAPVATTAGSQGLGTGAANSNGQGALNGQGAANRNPAAGGLTTTTQQQQAGQGQQGQSNGQGQGNGVAGVNSNNGQGQGNGVAGVNSNVPSNPNLHVLFDSAQAGAPKVYNLLDLRGGITAELATAQIPVGSYDRLRIVISSAELVVNGVSYSTQNGTLQITAGATAGILVTMPGPDPLFVVAGGVTQGLVDFDLARCFQPTGPANAPTGYVFTPVVRAADLGATGTLAGAVKSDNGTPNDPNDDLPLANAAVNLVQGATVLTTFADPNGVYVIQGLAEGAWEVKFTGAGHVDSPVTAAQIVRQQQTTLDATLVKQ